MKLVGLLLVFFIASIATGSREYSEDLKCIKSTTCEGNAIPASLEEECVCMAENKDVRYPKGCFCALVTMCAEGYPMCNKNGQCVCRPPLTRLPE